MQGMPIPEKGRRKVFISYSHKDSKWLKRLHIHLRDLERRNLVEFWDDTRIRPGDEWRKEIRAALDSSRAAVLLVSADFIASDFIAKEELPPLLAAAESEGVKILPLILSASLFEEIESLARFQAVNPPSKPLMRLSKGKQEEYLVELSKAILRAVEGAERQRITPANDENLQRPPGECPSDKLQSGKPDEIRAVASVEENYDVPEVWVEQASHLKTFVGREEILMQIHNWVYTTRDGGYYLLLGPWGQGKSALLAQLVERSKNEGLAFLFHSIKSKKTPAKILQFLIWQAEQLIGEPFSETAYAGDVDDLRNSLVGALIRVCKGLGRVLVVIDALDELDRSANRLNFLPEYLPAGIRVILSCRDESLQVSVLRERLQQLTVFPLPDLASEELRPFLESYLTPVQLSSLRGVDFDAVFRRIGGKPLALQRTIEIILEQIDRAKKQGVLNPTIDVMALPNTLDGVFEDIYNHITERVNGGHARKGGRVKERLIQLMSVAREALSIDDLYSLVRAEAEEFTAHGLNENRDSESVWPISSGELRECVRQMGENLLCYEGMRYLPSKEGLIAYLHRKVMVNDEIEAVHRVFCRWLDSPQQRQDPSTNRLRHLPHHLYMAHKYDELERLLLETNFLELKLSLPATSFLAAEDIKYLTLALLARGQDRGVIDLAITDKNFQRNGVISALRDDRPELSARISRIVDALLSADIPSSSSPELRGRWASLHISHRRPLSASTINAKRAAIEVAYHREMQEVLVKAAQDPIPVVRTLLVPYLYYFWREHRDGGWQLMKCLSSKLLRPWGVPDARILEAYGGMSLAILSYHFDDQKVLDQLREQWRENFRRLLHIPKNSGKVRKYLLRALFNFSIFILTNIVLKRLADQPEFQPINTVELAAAFPRSESGRHQLLAALECLEYPNRGFANCVDILLNNDTPFDVCLMVTLERALVLHGSPGMDPGGVITALKRIYLEGCPWFRRSALYVAFHTLKNMEHVEDEWMDSYDRMTRELIRTTRATFKTARGAYSLIPDMAWAEVVFDKHRPSGSPLFIPQFLGEAVASGDAGYVRRVVAASGILSLVYQRHQLALDALRDSLKTQDPKLRDTIVEILTNIRFFKPKIVDEFLAKQGVKELADQVERAIPTVRLADILHQFDEFFNHAMVNSPVFRAEMVAAFRCGAQARSLATWGKDVLKLAMNLFLDEKLFPTP
jgi:hypothetical protein